MKYECVCQTCGRNAVFELETHEEDYVGFCPWCGRVAYEGKDKPKKEVPPKAGGG